MRRRAPRPLSAALEQFGLQTAPPTLLARVQACWNETVGAAIAGDVQPKTERAGTLTVVCTSATWASELELLAPDLLEKLNLVLGDPGSAPLKALRTQVGKLP